MKLINEKLLKENIEKRALSDLEMCNISGCGIIVKQNGQTVYKNTFGTQCPGSKLPLREDATYRMASMTKPITAAAILIQVGRGKISVFDPIEKYYPEFNDLTVEKLENGTAVSLGKSTEKVTVFNLLTHTSGIGTGEIGDYYTSRMTAQDKKDLSSVIKYYSEMPLAFIPSTAQFYSPVAAFDILAGIVEQTSGMKYDEFLKKEIFDPLGMVDTTFAPTDDQWNRMIGMHNKSDGKSVAGYMPAGCVFADFPTTYFCGGAGLISTLSDYSRFAELLLRNDGEIIKPELIREMSTAKLTPDIMPGSQVWSYGVRVITDSSYKRLPVGTFGWSGAYGTHFWVDPENKVTAVYMKNSHYDGGSGALTAANFEIDVTESFTE